MSKNVVAGVTAAISNLIIPGSGQILVGQQRRFFYPLLGFVALLLFAGLVGLASKLFGFIALGASAIALQLFGIVDGWLQGFRQGFSSRKWYLSALYVTLWLIVMIAASAIWMTERESVLGYATYRVPGGAMAPTLLPGDIVLVDTRVTKYFAPSRNELVVILDPTTNAMHIRRLTGLRRGNIYVVQSDAVKLLGYSDVVQEVPQSYVKGVVTNILWSPTRKQFGRAPQ